MLLYSPAYIVLICLFISLLAIQVSALRWKFKIPHKDGGNEVLARARSAHFMMLEFSVVFMPLLICGELIGASNQWIAYTSLVFLVGRVCHTSGLMTTTGFSPLRGVGVVLSHGASLAWMGKIAFTLFTIAS
jgi:uncharacterized membrane protein YecN with MAPEG domain